MCRCRHLACRHCRCCFFLQTCRELCSTPGPLPPPRRQQRQQPYSSFCGSTPPPVSSWRGGGAWLRRTPSIYYVLFFLMFVFSDDERESERRKNEKNLFFFSSLSLTTTTREREIERERRQTLPKEMGACLEALLFNAKDGYLGTCCSCLERKPSAPLPRNREGERDLFLTKERNEKKKKNHRIH